MAKELVILSGKGGTGKTSVAGSFAVLASEKVLCDCDVDAADLHLMLDPRTSERFEFWSGQTARIDPDQCTQCGLCEENCRFDAIDAFAVEPTSCEGCGFCSRICPVGAISMEDNLAGEWFISETRHGPLVHARLGIAEENSGKLVTMVRNEAKRIAEEQNLNYIITDGPPGIGCPVISSLSGAAAALIVTEPTLSGMHDMDRVVGVCDHFGVPALICINKYDINSENTARIETAGREKGLPIVGKIPYDDVATEALVQGVSVVEYSDGDVARQTEVMWRSVLEHMGSLT